MLELALLVLFYFPEWTAGDSSCCFVFNQFLGIFYPLGETRHCEVNLQ